MKLNFELLEQKLEQEGQGGGANLPDSARVIVVQSGRDPPFSLNLLSQGSYTARGGTNRGDRSAGQDSLETVADFQGRINDGTHSNNTVPKKITPRLNNNVGGSPSAENLILYKPQTARLNQTVNRSQDSPGLKQQYQTITPVEEATPPLDAQQSQTELQN